VNSSNSYSNELMNDNQHKQPSSSSSSVEEDTTTLPIVLLKRNRQSKSFRDGSQLVFSGSVVHAPKTLRMGDVVQVHVSDNNTKDESSTTKNSISSNTLIGWGVYNPESMYRVRLLGHSIFDENAVNGSMNAFSTAENGDARISMTTSETVLRKVLMTNFQRAINTRRALSLPSKSVTDTYRLVNGEGDSISGLAVDVVGDEVAVIMSSAAWCEINQKVIIDCLKSLLPEHYGIVWKTTPSRLKQDGYEVKTPKNHLDDDEDHNQPGLVDRPVIATENGIKYQTFPFQEGQKTSVYCDQRVNRWNLAQYCSGKSVLDLCCYHGGFSLNAAKNGASNVVGVDSSKDAIDTCTANAALNDIKNVVGFVKADISDFMKTCSSRFDVVVLDPPKLAPSVSGLQRASRKYHSLNRDALKLVDDSGGLFMTCTCSAAMTQKDGGQFFLQTVHQAALAAKRQVTLISVNGAAPCHTQSPISYPAGNYLTAALFMVHPRETTISEMKGSDGS
jgi:23S rRNA (cytosine1962-C5)-methyltransferase